MTILELLDRLEDGIASLRARNREVELALRPTPSLNHDNRVKRPKSPKKKNGKASSKKKKLQKAVTTKPKSKPVQMPLNPAEGEETRQIGKRQALGRSILQLRRNQSPTAG